MSQAAGWQSLDAIFHHGLDAGEELPLPEDTA
jgi:hypothetical protein